MCYYYAILSNRKVPIINIIMNMLIGTQRYTCHPIGIIMIKYIIY